MLHNPTRNRLTAAIAATIACCLLLATEGSAQDMSAKIPSHTGLFRLPIPDELPGHPRVFCTAADLARIKSDLQAGDVYTRMCVTRIVSQAEGALTDTEDPPDAKTANRDGRAAASLGQAYALTGDERFGKRCRQVLLALADICPSLETTSAHGRFTDSTLGEGGLAVALAWAYDLTADAPFMTQEDRNHIEQDLLKIIAWECGHKCHHVNSSNWRTWALAIIASCGFAIGDRELIDEAINGVYDPERKAYLYGMVQTLTHSVFSDGIHWERSIGYTYYTGSAMMYVLVPAKNAGIDLWHTGLPGILGPFEGSAGHEEYGPAGDRSIKAFLDAPFYYAFPGGAFARIGDSGTGSLRYHPLYELAYREYADPKYAWLINNERQSRADTLVGWQVWRARGEPTGEVTREHSHEGEAGFRMKTGPDDRIGLVQNVPVPASATIIVSGWVKALSMDGGSAHLRANLPGGATFTQRVQQAGDWHQVTTRIEPEANAKPQQIRTIRLHVFLEGGAGEVVWDDIRVQVEGRQTNLLANGQFEEFFADGRRHDMWDLVHSAPKVPRGEYSLAPDVTIGISGRHENGCTLFPVGGFAILRGAADDPQAPAVNLTFGPYGSGHDHPDRLHFDLYGLGTVLCPDGGSWGYSNPMHLTWANQTVAHNTLTVDEISQQPQGTSKSIFAGERGSQRVFGVLRLFHPGERLKAVRATCDNAYPGVAMDRTLCLVGDYVLDVFRVSSDADHTYDLALHGPGRVTADAPTEALEPNPFEAMGYSHLTDLRRATPHTPTFHATFSHGSRSVSALHVTPQDAEVFLAKDPDRGAPVSSMLSRRRGKTATYVTVLEPCSGDPSVLSLATGRSGESLTVSVKAAAHEDRFRLQDAVEGSIHVERRDAEGHEQWQEETSAGL